MAERIPLWVSHAGGLVTVEDARLGVGALLNPGTSRINAKSGFRPGAGTSPGLVSATGTPDGFVHVAPFQLIKQTGRAGSGGAYVCTLDAIKDINILSTPANPTNPRNDLIIAQQSDEFYGDANDLFTVKQVVGTPAGSPADPSVTGSPDYELLARVRVDAGATTIVSGKITDLRRADLYTVALGGILPVPSTTARTAVTGYDGMPIYRTDRDWVEIYDGTAWRVQGVPVVTSIGDLANITDPYAGQVAYNTAVPAGLYVYSGSAWSPSAMRVVAKQVNETVTSSTTLQNDNELFATVEANSQYLVRCALIASCADAAADLKTAWTGPASATAVRMCVGPELGVTNAAGTQVRMSCHNMGTAVAYGVAGAVGVFEDFVLITSAAAGTLQLQWAQVASSATGMAVQLGSYMTILKIV